MKTKIFIIDDFTKYSKELGKRICELLENSEMVNSMGNESLNMVQKFSWDKVVSNILKIHKNITS